MGICLTFARCSTFACLSTKRLTTSCLPWKHARVRAVLRFVSIYRGGGNKDSVQ